MPNEYNIASDCVDRQPPSHPALISVTWDAAAGKTRVRTLTFGELKDLTNSFAHSLADRGLSRGDRVVIRLENGVDFPVAFIGTIKAGLIPVPASPLLTKSEFDFLVKDSGAKTVILSESEESSGITREILRHAQDDKHFTVQPTNASAPAYWLYTSGTEGTPKGVILPHRSIPPSS